jgi:putative addiction module component (TIGR02574 family)
MMTDGINRGAPMNEQHADVFQLSLPERLQLVEDLWDSIASEAENVPLLEWQRTELARREEEYRQNPSLASTWEDAKQRILERHGS